MSLLWPADLQGWQLLSFLRCKTDPVLSAMWCTGSAGQLLYEVRMQARLFGRMRVIILSSYAAKNDPI